MNAELTLFLGGAKAIFALSFSRNGDPKSCTRTNAPFFDEEPNDLGEPSSYPYRIKLHGEFFLELFR